MVGDNDVDGDALTAVLVSGPAHGTLVLNANGSFTYTPAAGYVGPDSFTYQARDGAALSNVATASLDVQAAAQGLGKINGLATLDGGRRNFLISVHGHANKHGPKYSGHFVYADLQNGLLLTSTEITDVRVDASGAAGLVQRHGPSERPVGIHVRGYRGGQRSSRPGRRQVPRPDLWPRRFCLR